MTDAQARAAALDPRRSFLVQAPAGSGKTELLIQRYLTLLARVEDPAAVLAITFTRKAANEMRERVLGALREASIGSRPEDAHREQTFRIAADVLEADRRLGWKLLLNSSQLRIQTIDGLCASIAGQMPWLSRFGPMPNIVENATAFYKEAARRTLHMIEGDHDVSDDVAHLLLHLDNDAAKAEGLLCEMLGKRDQWLPLIGVRPKWDAVRGKLEQNLEFLVQTEIAKARAQIPGAVAEAASELGRRAAVHDPSQEQFQSLGLCEGAPGLAAVDLRRWRALACVLLTSNGTLRKRHGEREGFPQDKTSKALASRLRELAGEDETIRDAFKMIRSLPDPAYSESEWRALKAVLAILPLACTHLKMVFAENGAADFSEVSEAALHALGALHQPSDLALAMGSRIEHILVDEFQDTSRAQFELLKRLTAGWSEGDGQTLFVVGDPMQSIYRFRQAEVRLFFRARDEGIGNVRLERLQLTANFRSTEAIVGWVNHQFGPLMDSENPAEESVRYELCEPIRNGTSSPLFHAAWTPADEAAAVTGLVSGEGKTAILVRARTHLTAIIPALQAAKLPFQAVDIYELGERPVVRDLLALTFALVHPGDRLSWFAILRAPWCALRLADLERVADTGDEHMTIWAKLQRGSVPFSEDAAARWARMRPVMAAAMAECGRKPLRDVVENAWRQLGGPACVDNAGDLDDALSYLDLLSEIERGGGLPSLAQMRDRVAALFAKPDPLATDALQVMTIHKAKGLEFDRVILPALERQSKVDERPMLLWHWVDDDHVLMAAHPEKRTGLKSGVYEYLSALERRKAKNEQARILYVAATRAKNELHLSASRELDNRTGQLRAPKGGTLLSLVQQWPEAASNQLLQAGVPQTESENTRAAGVALRRLTLDWRLPEPPSAARRELPPPEAMSRIPSASPRDTERKLGIVLHAFLQQIGSKGLSNWTKERLRGSVQLIRAALEAEGVRSSELDGSVQWVTAALTRTLSDPRGQWILRGRADSACELALGGILEGVPCSVRIDRTFVEEDGVRWIVDYKTGEVQNEEHVAQLEHYARLFRLTGEQRIRLGLYSPVTGEWSEWDHDPVLAAHGAAE